jgi:hypothetical protein
VVELAALIAASCHDNLQVENSLRSGVSTNTGKDKLHRTYQLDLSADPCECETVNNVKVICCQEPCPDGQMSTPVLKEKSYDSICYCGDDVVPMSVPYDVIVDCVCGDAPISDCPDCPGPEDCPDCPGPEDCPDCPGVCDGNATPPPPTDSEPTPPPPTVNEDRITNPGGKYGPAPEGTTYHPDADCLKVLGKKEISFDFETEVDGHNCRCCGKVWVPFSFCTGPCPGSQKCLKKIFYAGNNEYKFSGERKVATTGPDNCCCEGMEDVELELPLSYYDSIGCECRNKKSELD